MGDMTTPDLELLRLATRRFHELQGLRTIVFAVACSLAFWSHPFIKELRYAGPLAALLGLVLSFLPFGAALFSRVLDGYYSRRFGRITVPPARRAVDVGAPLLLLLAGIWIDSINLGEGRPSASLTAGAVLAAHTTLRDWKWRSYYLIALVGCILGVWLTVVFSPMRADSMIALAQGPITWLLASFIPPAYLDHRLLVTTMPRRADVEGVEQVTE